MVSKVNFNTPLTYTDGSAIASADLAAATYTALIDTVNPPLQPFPVPAASVTGGVANPDGSKHVTALFTELGFTPAANVTYFVQVTATVKGVKSAPSSPVVSFQNVVAPNPPTAVSAS